TLHELAKSTSKRLLFYCAFGERSAMAVQAAQDAGLASACHIEGGIGAWKKAQGPLAHARVSATWDENRVRRPKSSALVRTSFGSGAIARNARTHARDCFGNAI